jgi:hypothetical protein
MYFKLSLRNNPATGKSDGYYRLVESYRNEYNRICHRTLLNIGFIDIQPEKLNSIKTILNDRVDRKASLFEEQDPEVVKLADDFWNRLVANGKVDDSDKAFEKKRRMVDVDTIKNKDAREVGAEWMCFQALEQLKLKDKLIALNWDEERIQLALTQIISRAVYPYSEHRTSRWIKQNSAICEVTGYPMEKVTKDKLYKSALDLYKIKDTLEQHLSNRTNELFDLKDKIILYDLTNTYFEGSKRKSKLAQYAKNKSKEKRNDAKIIVLALVVNVEGFIKFSSVFEGKKSDSSSLPDIIDKIRLQTSNSRRAIVVIDAGIATNDNLDLIKSKGYDYVCVEKGKVKDYQIDPNSETQKVISKAKDVITLESVVSEKYSDYLLKVHSEGKLKTERSMKSQFEDRFRVEIEKAKLALTKKGGIKKIDKVERRIGRAIEKYPSMAKHFEIEVKTQGDVATEIIINPKESYQVDQKHHGVYFIRTNLQIKDQRTVWDIYNTIREIENSFRCLKTDLDLRPVYHKSDNATLAHLHLGLLAYWLANTIRYQLKSKSINHSWQEIVRITNTQKVVTTSGQNTFNEIVSVRRCTEPTPKVKEIYQALGFRNYPFVKRKSVVHKPELKKNKPLCLREIHDG